MIPIQLCFVARPCTVISFLALVGLSGFFHLQPFSMAQAERVDRESTGLQSTRTPFLRIDPWQIQNPVSQVAANLFHRVIRPRLSEVFSANLQEPQMEPDPLQLKRAAVAEFEKLRGRKEVLAADDMGPLWDAVRRLHEAGYDSREDVILLYGMIDELPLGLRDRLEVCRFLGQDFLFRNYLDEAERLFDRAVSVFKEADPIQQEQVARKMANILYLRGLLRESQQSIDLLLENDRELYSNRMLWNATPVATKASLLERLGDQMARRKELEEAREKYLEAVDVLRKGDERDTEQNSTIRLLIKTLRVEIAAGKVTLAEAIQRLEEMRKDYATGNWVGMEEVLKQLAVYYRENKDPANYQKVLSSLCDWYREQRSDPNRVMLTVSLIDQGILDSTKLLVLSRLETGDRAGAVELIRETLRRDKPPEWWVNHFPDDVRTEAMEQSVVGEKSGEGKKPAEPDRESSADRNGEGGRIPAGEGRR